jgi:hypothetical protein
VSHPVAQLEVDVRVAPLLPDPLLFDLVALRIEQLVDDPAIVLDARQVAGRQVPRFRPDRLAGPIQRLVDLDMDPPPRVVLEIRLDLAGQLFGRRRLLQTPRRIRCLLERRRDLDLVGRRRRRIAPLPLAPPGIP